jgi:electron transfer flavoprotein alpha subunit
MMTDPILVFCEQRESRLKKVGLEAIGEASRLGAQSARPIIAVLIGAEVDALADEVGRAGAARVLLAQHASLRFYSAESYCGILAEAAQRLRPAAIFLGATAMGKDLGPKLAARLRSPLATDCVAMQMEPDGTLVATRAVYGGKLRAVVKSRMPFLQVASLRPNMFSVSPNANGGTVTVERLPVPEPTTPRAVVRGIEQAGARTAELTEASIIVSGGRGLKGPENFKLVEELAAALGAAVGASRAAVDAGWKPHSYQVGLTGKTVSPQLYIACGISGAIQHQAGMSSARVIVAINNNASAPIFKLATYGVVGDLFEALPLLTEEVKRLKATGGA